MKKKKVFVVGPAIMPLRALKSTYIKWVLDQLQGNKAEAARALGISTRTIYNQEEGEKKYV